MKIFKLQEKGNNDNEEAIINRLFRSENTYHGMRNVGIFIMNNELYIESNRWDRLIKSEYTVNDLKKYFIYTSTNSVNLKPELYIDYIDKKYFTTYSENELFFSIKIENILLDIIDREKLIFFYKEIYQYLLDKINLIKRFKLEFTEEFKKSYIYSILYMHYLL